MNYPTAEEVLAADRIQICRWWRFLPSPGAVSQDNGELSEAEFRQILAQQQTIMNLIAKRFDEVGGFTPEISKLIGFKEN